MISIRYTYLIRMMTALRGYEDLMADECKHLPPRDQSGIYKLHPVVRDQLWERPLARPVKRESSLPWGDEDEDDSDLPF